MAHGEIAVNQTDDSSNDEHVVKTRIHFQCEIYVHFLWIPHFPTKNLSAYPSKKWLMGAANIAVLLIKENFIEWSLATRASLVHFVQLEVILL